MLPFDMTTEPAAPDSAADYTIRRDALAPPGLPASVADEQALALGLAVRLITEAHQAYSRSGMTRPFFDFVRIVLTTKEER